ncbi:hypothetical protein HN419_03405 [Candidatus Woesearchaeota archaeon]|nr:hypothetical protein [Candidatus Woesearchaeota archaeon]
MSSEQTENNVRSVLQLLSLSSGKGERGRRKLFYRTLGGPQNLPEVVTAIEKLESIKDSLPKSLWPLVTNIKDMLENSLVATTSVKGAMLTMLTTQKSEFKVNHPALRRSIGPQMMRGMDSE